MTITYQVYRLLDDGEEQSLGYFVNDRDAMIKAFEYYSEVRYPHAYVDYREVQFMLLSPTLHKAAVMYNNPQTIIEDNIDFWYDSLNDCYANRMPIEMICTYVEAITDDDTE